MRFGGVLVMMKSDSSRSTKSDDGRAHPVREQDERLGDHPAEDAAGTGEHGHAVGRGGLAAEHVAERARPEQQHPRPMPMRVLSWTRAGCRNSQTANISMMTGSANATRPNRPPKVHVVEHLRDGVVEDEPLHDGAGDREQHDEERHAVAPLLLLQGLVAERAAAAPR